MRINIDMLLGDAISTGYVCLNDDAKHKYNLLCDEFITEGIGDEEYVDIAIKIILNNKENDIESFIDEYDYDMNSYHLDDIPLIENIIETTSIEEFENIINKFIKLY